MATPDAMRIREEILRLCEQRGSDKSICPSEVARTLWAEETEWRSRMETVRNEAFSLAKAGRVVVTQRGKVLTDCVTKGPVRISLS